MTTEEYNAYAVKNLQTALDQCKQERDAAQLRVKELETQLALEKQAWPLLNRERGSLIDKKIAGTLTAEEERRLDKLQQYTDQRSSEFDKARIAVLEELKRKLSGPR
jgi:hypothetical protein